jgi:FlaA1/EpsC-like NDP-sugar epimerase
MVTLLPQLKRKQVPHHSLFWGPLSRFLSRYFSWFLVDLLAAAAAVAAAGVIWRSGQPLDLGWATALAAALGIALVFSLVNVLLRLDRVYWSKAPADAVFDLGLSCGLATAGMALGNHYWPEGPLLPGGLLLVSGLLAFLGFVAARYRARILTGIATRWLKWRAAAPTMGERVLVIGAGEAGDFATWLLRKGDLHRAFSLVGMVDDAPSKQKASVCGLPVLGSTADIPELVHTYDVGLLLFSIVDIAAEERERILALCRRTTAHIVMVPSILDTLRQHFVKGEGRGEKDELRRTREELRRTKEELRRTKEELRRAKGD